MHWGYCSLSLIWPDTQMAVIEWSNYNRICKSPIHSDEPCVGRGSAVVRGGQTRTKQLTFSAARIVPELMKSQIRTSDCEGWTWFLAAQPPGWEVGMAGRGGAWSRVTWQIHALLFIRIRKTINTVMETEAFDPVHCYLCYFAVPCESKGALCK